MLVLVLVRMKPPIPALCRYTPRSQGIYNTKTTQTNTQQRLKPRLKPGPKMHHRASQRKPLWTGLNGAVLGTPPMPPSACVVLYCTNPYISLGRKARADYTGKVPGSGASSVPVPVPARIFRWPGPSCCSLTRSSASANPPRLARGLPPTQPPGQ